MEGFQHGRSEETTVPAVAQRPLVAGSLPSGVAVRAFNVRAAGGVGGLVLMLSGPVGSSLTVRMKLYER